MRTRGSVVALTAGLALLLAGTVVLAVVAWQYWGTTWMSERRHRELVVDVERAWAEDRDAIEADEGRVGAVVRIPRLDEGRPVPLLAGTSDAALAAGFGHVEGTAEPGGRGNLVLAGHRITHGEPLRDMPLLEPGDEVVVETRTKVYTYVLDTAGADLSVSFADGWVLERRPVNPDPAGVGPESGVGGRLLTLTTCAELFHTDQRLVAFGHLASVEDQPV